MLMRTLNIYVYKKRKKKRDKKQKQNKKNRKKQVKKQEIVVKTPLGKSVVNKVLDVDLHRTCICVLEILTFLTYLCVSVEY